MNHIVTFNDASVDYKKFQDNFKNEIVIVSFLNEIGVATIQCNEETSLKIAQWLQENNCGNIDKDFEVGIY
jgi:hypothetical protein